MAALVRGGRAAGAASGPADAYASAPVADTVIVHPNRGKAASKAMKASVVLLLLVSAALVAIVTIGGWAQLQGAQMVSVAYVLIYLIIAYFVARWNRGVLPVIAALAIILLIFAAVSGPEWFDRDKQGFADPALDESVLGLLTLALVPLQVLLIVFAARGFTQKWSVEVERSPPGGSPHAAQPA